MKTRIACYASGLLAGLFVLAQPSFGATKYDQNIEKSFGATPGGKLVIDADRGAIAVTNDATEQVQVRVFRQVHGGSQAEADALFGNHEVTFDQDYRSNNLSQRTRKRRRMMAIVHRRAHNQPGVERRVDVPAGGRYVAFQSGASNLVPSDTNGLTRALNGYDIFVRDRELGRTERISIASSGAELVQNRIHRTRPPRVARRDAPA